jgi:hypothetical protein
MRDSLNKLVETCETKADTMESFLQGIEQSGWLRHRLDTKFPPFSVCFAKKNLVNMHYLRKFTLLRSTYIGLNAGWDPATSSWWAPDPTQDQGLATTLTVKVFYFFFFIFQFTFFLLSTYLKNYKTY